MNKLELDPSGKLWGPLQTCISDTQGVRELGYLSTYSCSAIGWRLFSGDINSLALPICHMGVQGGLWCQEKGLGQWDTGAKSWTMPVCTKEERTKWSGQGTNGICQPAWDPKMESCYGPTDWPFCCSHNLGQSKVLCGTAMQRSTNFQWLPKFFPRPSFHGSVIVREKLIPIKRCKNKASYCSRKSEIFLYNDSIFSGIRDY